MIYVNENENKMKDNESAGTEIRGPDTLIQRKSKNFLFLATIADNQCGCRYSDSQINQ